MRLPHEVAEILEGPVVRVDVVVVSNIIPVIAHGGRIKRHQPDHVDAKVLDIIELFRKSDEVAHTILDAVVEGLDVQLIDDGIPIPEGIIL
jgi:hypothetical protein